jgi:hypothetical protein
MRSRRSGPSPPVRPPPRAARDPRDGRRRRPRGGPAERHRAPRRSGDEGCADRRWQPHGRRLAASAIRSSSRKNALPSVRSWSRVSSGQAIGPPDRLRDPRGVVLAEALRSIRSKRPLRPISASHGRSGWRRSSSSVR